MLRKCFLYVYKAYLKLFDPFNFGGGVDRWFVWYLRVFTM